MGLLESAGERGGGRGGERGGGRAVASSSISAPCVRDIRPG